MPDFKSVHVEGTTLGDVWFQLLHKLYEHGRTTDITAGSYAGAKRLEFDFASGFIHRPHDRPLAPIMPEGSNVPSPTSDEAIEQYFANYLMNPILEDNEHYKYAQWINGSFIDENMGTITYCNLIKCEHIKEDIKQDITGREKICDVNNEKLVEYVYEDRSYFLKHKIIKCPLDKPMTPIEWVIYHFKTKGYSNNHCAINIGDKTSNLAYEWPYKDETERGTSPCLRYLDFKIKNNKLILTIVYRSWDLYSGWPENMGGFTLLNEYVAEHLDGVEPGPLAFSSPGLHCYDFQLDVLKARLNKQNFSSF